MDGVTAGGGGRMAADSVTLIRIDRGVVAVVDGHTYYERDADLPGGGVVCEAVWELVADYLGINIDLWELYVMVRTVDAPATSDSDEDLELGDDDEDLEAGDDDEDLEPGDEPSLDQLEEWLDEGVCEALDGCMVEPDGHCPHGSPSWLLHLGLI